MTNPYSVLSVNSPSRSVTRKKSYSRKSSSKRSYSRNKVSNKKSLKIPKCIGEYSWSTYQAKNRAKGLLGMNTRLNYLDNSNVFDWHQQNILYWKSIHPKNKESNLPKILDLMDDSVDSTPINKEFITLWNCDDTNRIFAINVLRLIKIIFICSKNLILK